MDIIPSEIIGTMLLILLGDGVVAAVLLAKSKAENSGWIVITFGWGFAVMVGAYSVGQFSGAHLNPAVTLGIWINGGIDFGEAIQYWIGEFIGAAIGAVLVLGILAITAKGNGFGVGPALTNMGTLLVALLVLGIGLSLGGPTGYAINPARDLSPRIIHAILPVPGKGDSDWGYAWIPVVGPMVGGALGALLYVVAWPG